MSDTFSCAEVLCSIPSDEVLACGAAVEAANVTYNHGEKCASTQLWPNLEECNYVHFNIQYVSKKNKFNLSSEELCVARHFKKF